MDSQSVPTGRYEYNVLTDTWFWSEEVFDLYGQSSAETTPTTALFVDSVHPDDREQMWEAFFRCCQEDGTWGGLWRVVHSDGSNRYASFSGRGILEDGKVVKVGGYVVDVSSMHWQAVSQEVSQQLAKALDSRGPIDQAKGALMFLYGMGEDSAFQALKWCSQRTNEKLSVIAERVLEVARSGTEISEDARKHLDELLYTVATGTGKSIPATSASSIELDIVFVGEQQEVRMLEVVGSVDLSSISKFSVAVSQLLSGSWPPFPPVIDLRRVEYFGSAGFPVLMTAKRRCEVVGGTLRLVVAADNLSVVDSVRDQPGIAIFQTVAEAAKYE